MSNKKNNPLYHISNDGKDVESVSGFIELVVKKLGLDPVVSMLEEFFQFLMDQVTSYAMFTAVKDIFDELIGKLFELVTKVRPLLNI
jgi:hypothetical protein